MILIAVITVLFLKVPERSVASKAMALVPIPIQKKVVKSTAPLSSDDNSDARTKTDSGSELPLILLLYFSFLFSSYILREAMPAILESKHHTSAVGIGYIVSLQALGGKTLKINDFDSSNALIIFNSLGTIMGFSAGPLMSKMYRETYRDVVIHGGFALMVKICANSIQVF